jgi:hypothetical protein
MGAWLSQAGRLEPEDLQRFLASPLIPSLIMNSIGWTESEAKLFQEFVLASLTNTPV